MDERNKETLVMGIAIVSLLLGSFFLSMDMTKEAAVAETRGAPDAGKPVDWWVGVGSALYTPILVDFNGDTNIEVIVGDNNVIRCYQWDGTLLWSAQTQGGIHNSPTIADLDGDGEVEVTVFTEYENALVALDKNGNRLWTYALPGGMYGSTSHHSAPSGDLNGDQKLESIVVAQQRNAEVATWDGQVYGQGDIGMTGLGWHSSPVITNLDEDNTTNEYVCAANNGQMFAITSTGARLWTWDGGYGGWEVSSPGAGDLDGDGKNEIFGNTEVGGGHHVVCLDNMGALKWVYEGGGAFYSSPAAADLNGNGVYSVIAASTDQNVYALNGTDGTVEWQANLGYKIKPSPALGDVNGDGIMDVIAVNSKGVCYALNGSNGNVIWSYDPGASSEIPDSSVVADPSPVVGDINSDGYLDVLYSDGDGMLHVLGTEGVCAPSALTWPMFRYCREHTGYYNGTLEYGCLLRPDEDANDPNPLVHFVDPGTYTTFYLEIVNVGHQSKINGILKDKFTLGIDESSTFPEGWSADIHASGVPINDGSIQTDTPEATDFNGVNLINNIQLLEKEEMEFELRVHAPVAGVHYGDHAYVNLTAYSQTDPGNATDSITTLSIINITIDFDVLFAGDVDEDPFTGQKVMSISPGEKVVVSVAVINKGNVNDTVTVNLSIDASNWKVYIDPNSIYRVGEKTAVVDLSAPAYGEHQKTLDVIVEAPSTAFKGETADLYASGESEQARIVGISMPPVEDRLRFMVSGATSLQMSCEEDTLYFDPGETKSFDVKIKNLGNQMLTINFDLLGSYNDPYSGYYDPMLWNGSVVNTNGAGISSVTLSVNGEMHIFVKIQAPARALADSRVVLTLKGFVPNDPTIKDSVDLTGIVNRVSGIEAEILDEDEGSTKPGGFLNFTVELTNIGNADDTVELKPSDVPSYWNFTFITNEGYEVVTIDLGPRESVTVLLTVQPSSDAVVDADPSDEGLTPYTLVFNASISDKIFVHFSVDIRIKQVFDIGITPLQKEKATDPGSTVNYLFMLENKGNWKDVINLSVMGDELWDQDVYASGWTDKSKGKKPGWYLSFDYISTSRIVEVNKGANFNGVIDLSGYIDDMGTVKGNIKFIHNTSMDYQDLSVLLAPGQVGYVALTVTTDTDTPIRMYDVPVKADSTGRDKNPDNNEASVVLALANSDVIITDVSFPDEMVEGELVTIRVTVKNIGEIPAENVKVQVKVGGEEIGEVVVKNIQPGDSKVATFTWRAEAIDGGDQKLRVKLDPDNTLAEGSGESNNEMDVKINVKKKGLFGLPGFEMIGALLAMIIAGLIAMAARQRMH